VRAIFHRLVSKDLKAALGYYESEGGPKLGDRFFDDVEKTVARVAKNPQAFHFMETGRFRRVSLERFPYHFLFEVRESDVRFLVMRHDKRHPAFGLRRR